MKAYKKKRGKPSYHGLNYYKKKMQQYNFLKQNNQKQKDFKKLSF